VGQTVACLRCGASNRLDAKKLRHGLQPSCGRCAARLPLESQVLEVNDTRFDDQVLASSLPVLLDVWAPWCVPCRGMEPVIDEIATSLAGRVLVAKLNIDRSPACAARLAIQGVPTFLVFKGGREVARMVGARGKAELLRALAGVT